MSEKWLPVVGYEGLYEVSDEGRVRSLDRVSSDGSRRKGRVLTPTGINHVHVTLSSRGVKRKPSVHRLVLEAFLGPPPAGAIGCHRDDDPRNNCLRNLYWGSHSQNYSDSVVNGGRDGRVGAFTEHEVRAIRARVASGEKQASVARSLGVDPSTVSLMVNRRTWKNVA